MISNELSLSTAEADMLLEMQDKGVEVSMQLTPRDEKIALNHAVKLIREKANE